MNSPRRLFRQADSLWPGFGRTVFAVADGIHAGRFDSQSARAPRAGQGAPFAESTIVFFSAALIAMALNAHSVAHCLQVRRPWPLWISRQISQRAVEIEMDGCRMKKRCVFKPSLMAPASLDLIPFKFLRLQVPSPPRVFQGRITRRRRFFRS